MNYSQVVFLSGHMCTPHIFNQMIKRLPDSLQCQFPLITGNDSVGQLAADVLQSSPRTFALAGHSMGGIVAMEIARMAPSRISRLMLMSTNHKAERAEVAELRKQRVARASNGEFEAVVSESIRPEYIADSADREGILKFTRDMAMELGTEVFVRQSLALISRLDQTETLKALRMPTTLVSGTGDVLCPPEYHREMHELIAGSRLLSVPGAGHMITLERPDIVASAVCGWLDL